MAIEKIINEISGQLVNRSDPKIENSLIIQVPPIFESITSTISFWQQCNLLCQQDQTIQVLILNFKKIILINSLGIGFLISLLRKNQEAKIELILQDVNPTVKTALQFTDLDKALKINNSDTSDTKVSSPINLKRINQLLMTHASVCSSTKRLIDIMGSLIGLSMTAILFIPIAIAIKIDSPGPVLFSQIRYGWMGKPFRFWKFRSMVANAEALIDQVPNQIQGAFFKNDNDPRITRLGSFLRRVSLDELPQFWNVFKGEMSLVGPRPPIDIEVKEYDIAEWKRFDVKPGMTGEWQVNGRSRIRTFREVMELDLLYLSKWSIWYDIKLILKTAQVLFSGV